MPYHFPRCQIVPLPGRQAAFEVDAHERLRWHFGTDAPRPFFYPLIGPSGASLTRMGHPGAANHDHHRSIWFAHHQVVGVDFWSDRTPATIRQTEWLAYRDGDDEAVLASRLGWYDGHDPAPLLDQELVAAIRPDDAGGTLLELQTTFRPTADTLEFGKTNYGFLAVRVAKRISAYFGGGVLTDGEGRVGEPAIFGQRAHWMDYSGPAPGGGREGITYFDHPSNPGAPSRWHVREDGWMGACVCRDGPVVTRRDAPLTLRYLLHAHAGEVDPAQAALRADEFAAAPGFVVSKATVKHRQYVVGRESAT